MSNLKTPGIYIQEVEQRKFLPFQTNIVGFVGICQKGPLNSPQRITAWKQFQDIFGVVVSNGYLAYAVNGFFRNGGTTCYIVRVAKDAVKAKKMIAQELIEVNAINEGEWGNEITGIIEPSSSDNIILTHLSKKIEGEESLGSPPSPHITIFESVAGLGVGDKLMLLHPNDSSVQAKVEIDFIDYATNEVSLFFDINERLNLPSFPIGSLVIGKGIKLIFKYLSRIEEFDNLSLSRNHERYFRKIINGVNEELIEGEIIEIGPVEKDYLDKLSQGHSILVEVSLKDPKNIPPRPIIVENENRFDLNSGSDSASGNHNFSYTDFTGSMIENEEQNLVGLRALELVEDISIIAIPDLVISETENNTMMEDLLLGYQDMSNHCMKMGNRFAILDPPKAISVKDIIDWLDNIRYLPELKNGALYYPWLKVKPPSDLLNESSITLLEIPPSGHIAGIYALNDVANGVNKAPANEVVLGAVDLVKQITEEDQAQLNPVGINCLRSFPGRGINIWGARTLSHEILWRYVNVRRVCLAIKGYILQNLKWIMFELNDPILLARIRTSLSVFFENLALSGMLSGDIPENLFSVKCDEENNPPELVDQGQLVVEIQFRVAVPAEFIKLIITKSSDTINISEE